MAKDENKTPFEQAEEKIAEALTSGATKLNLKQARLTELPRSLGQLTQLRALYLFGNQLKALPEWLGKLTELRTLDLSNNQLKALPESLGKLTELRTLDLTNNQLKALPESLGQLAQLQQLAVSDNQLTALPESLSQLTRLDILKVSHNQLTALPDSLGRLTQLQTLEIAGNGFGGLPDVIRRFAKLDRLVADGIKAITIPKWIGELRTLTQLEIDNNSIRELPDSFGSLSRLKLLFLGDISTGGNPLGSFPDVLRQITTFNDLDVTSCGITSIPDWIGEFSALSALYLNSNSLCDLPGTVAQLDELETLELDENPLNPELAAAYDQGPDAVKAYLRERAKGTRNRYEAKLLILGDGNEGKTCVSRALRGKKFKKQNTTRGVDVVPWTFTHPDHPKDGSRRIKLNIWDFEGQEINHQTHQFFLSTDSLYVLVFKCRDQFLLDRAEYWLDTIRSRAPGTRVAVVITECEQRTPYVPQDRLLNEYADLLGDDRWLFPVGCEDNSGVSELQAELQRRAADLEFMGRPWPDTFRAAETKIEKEAKNTSHITRGTLHDVFEESNIDADGYGEAARSLARLGVITQFPDCPDLTDFIVLQPQWLTKAISHLMEDRQVTEKKGEITFDRMQEIWAEHDHAPMFAVFHNCMKEFELCYDLENYNDRCLVPLRFEHLKPDIPWTAGEPFKTRRVTYRLNLRPPMGLMSRFIVKTHHMIVRREADDSTANGRRGVYWHNGVFLQSGDGPLLSQALCQFDAESRTLSVEVRAAFPQKMLDQIDAYVRAVFAFFQGLKPVRSYGCISVDAESQAETPCEALHKEADILFALECQEKILCSTGRHKVAPMQLIYAVSHVSTDLRRLLRSELDKEPIWAEPLIHNIETLLDWAEEHQDTLQQLRDDQANVAPEMRQEFELKLREYLAHMSDMLDERHQKSAPSVFSIGTENGSPWNPQTYFKQTYVLTPWCECEGNMHRHEDGNVTYPTNRAWWDRTAPWIARGTKVLAAGLQLAFAGMPMGLGNDVYDVVKNDVTFMKELAKHLKLEAEQERGDTDELLSVEDQDAGERIKDVRGKDGKTALMRAALTGFLERLAPDNYRAGQWGDLKRVRLPDNTYRWLCEEHAEEVRR